MVSKEELKTEFPTAKILKFYLRGYIAMLRKKSLFDIFCQPLIVKLKGLLAQNDKKINNSYLSPFAMFWS